MVSAVFMQIGFVSAESGQGRAKNVKNILLKVRPPLPRPAFPLNPTTTPSYPDRGCGKAIGGADRFRRWCGPTVERKTCVYRYNFCRTRARPLHRAQHALATATSDHQPSFPSHLCPSSAASRNPHPGPPPAPEHRQHHAMRDLLVGRGLRLCVRQNGRRTSRVRTPGCFGGGELWCSYEATDACVTGQQWAEERTGQRQGFGGGGGWREGGG
jgi:hypothetical protein